MPKAVVPSCAPVPGVNDIKNSDGTVGGAHVKPCTGTAPANLVEISGDFASSVDVESDGPFTETCSRAGSVKNGDCSRSRANVAVVYACGVNGIACYGASGVDGPSDGPFVKTCTCARGVEAGDRP